MSKCQRTKYLAGGRCGTGRNTSGNSSGETSSAFSALLAAREAQTAALWKPATASQQQISKEIPLTQGSETLPLTQSQSQSQLVLHSSQNQQHSRKKDIDMILKGDLDWE